MDNKIYRGSYYGIEKTFTVPDKQCFTDEQCLIEVGSLIHYVASQITGLVAVPDTDIELREITLIGGKRHGEIIILNKSAAFRIKPFKDVSISGSNTDTYTICQLKSGQWIGYIATEIESG